MRKYFKSTIVYYIILNKNPIFLKPLNWNTNLNHMMSSVMAWSAR